MDTLHLQIGGIIRHGVSVALFQSLPGSLLHDVLNSSFVQLDTRWLRIDVDWMTVDKMDLLLDTYKTGKVALSKPFTDNELAQLFTFFQIPESALPAVYKWRQKNAGKVERLAGLIRDGVVAMLDQQRAGEPSMHGVLSLTHDNKLMAGHERTPKTTADKKNWAYHTGHISWTAVIAAATNMLQLEGFEDVIIREGQVGVVFDVSMEPKKKQRRC